jgi:hypothetical protein
LSPNRAAKVVDSLPTRTCGKEEVAELAINTPGRIRTCDRRIRNPLLYPSELRAHYLKNRH